jgi:hypothetical protein
MDKQIIYEDIDLEHITLSGIDSKGKEYMVNAIVSPSLKEGEVSFDENLVRYRLATHKKCESCGKIISIHGFTTCEECRNKKEIEKYLSLPVVEFTDFPLALYDGDEFFFDSDDLYSYLDDRDKEDIGYIQLITTKVISLPYIDLRDQLEENFMNSDDVDLDYIFGLDSTGRNLKELEELVNTSLSEMYYKNGNKYYESDITGRILLGSVINIDEYLKRE